MLRGVDSALWAASAATVEVAKASRLSLTTTSSRMKASRESNTRRS